MGQPSETPKTMARSEPTASITERTSSIRTSSDGSRSYATRSERPTPRLSNRIRRENEARRRRTSRGWVPPTSPRCSSSSPSRTPDRPGRRPPPGRRRARRPPSSRTASLARPSPDHPVQAPAVGDALQLVPAGILEHEARAGHEILHRLGHEHLARSGERPDAGADVDGDATDVVAPPLDFARVQPSSDLDPEGAHGLGDRARASDRPGGSVEGREEAIAGGVDLAPPVAGQHRAHGRVVAGDQFVPPAIAERYGALGRADDVGEQHRHERAVERRLLLADRRNEALELGDHALRVADERWVFLPRQHEQIRTRDLARDPPALVHWLGSIVLAVQHQRWHLDGG